LKQVMPRQDPPPGRLALAPGDPLVGQGRRPFLENLDGFDQPSFCRSAQHTLGLRLTSGPATRGDVELLDGTFGLVGATRDPLADVFLVPLRLPWISLVEVFPEPLWPWLGVAAPLVNIALLAAPHHYARRR
jgi:hypothetical protein